MFKPNSSTEEVNSVKRSFVIENSKLPWHVDLSAMLSSSKKAVVKSPSRESTSFESKLLLLETNRQ